MPRAPRSRGLQALHDRYIGDDPAKVDAFEAAKSNAEVARSIYRLRTAAGLTQRALAALVGTTASVICRLEDADYDGHSLAMLNRVAGALDRRVEVRFPPATASRLSTDAPGVKTAKSAGPGTKAKSAKVKAAPAKARPAKGARIRRVKTD